LPPMNGLPGAYLLIALKNLVNNKVRVPLRFRIARKCKETDLAVSQECRSSAPLVFFYHEQRVQENRIQKCLIKFGVVFPDASLLVHRLPSSRLRLLVPCTR